MLNINRRSFIKNTAIGVAGLSIVGCAGKYRSEFIPKKEKRVIVVGGGFGGCTAAKYIKLNDPSIEVILVEKNSHFVSCPISNLVIVGLKDMNYITFKYDLLEKNYGIKVLQTEALELNSENNTLITTKGALKYDKLILSPGVGFIEDKSIGYSLNLTDKIPHAWKAGRQTEILRRQLSELKKGGTVILRVPKSPYRCPPGPYERASLIANFIKRNNLGGKIIILDSNDDVTSKGKLFKAAWDDFYRRELEYFSQVDVQNIDTENMIIDTNKGKIKADIINFIPDQKASNTAFKLGLVKEDKLWAFVNSYTFESEMVKDVYVVGDSTNTGSVGTVPKSGYIANSMGKVVAESVVASLNGKTPPKPFMANACYSMVSDTEAIWVTAVYEYDENTKRTITIKGASGTPKTRSKIDAKHQLSWAENIWSDTLM
ncbi:FAD-dependent oxidoreductase [Deferribacteraceae bacterium V6Fe1]|nr:FAD-dependent oxidoreductase [Deferribacteraceae bacterium V6Fe1]